MILLAARLASQRNGPATRAEILNLLRHEPGLTKTQVCRRLGLGWGTVSHHIRVMERERQVVQRRFLGFNRIYWSQARSPELSLMPLLRDSLVPHLLERIQRSPGIGIQALSKELSLGRKVVRRQLLALVESGLLQRSEHYRPRFYLREEGAAFLQRHVAVPGMPPGRHGPDGRDGGRDGGGSDADRMPALRP